MMHRGVFWILTAAPVWLAFSCLLDENWAGFFGTGAAVFFWILLDLAVRRELETIREFERYRNFVRDNLPGYLDGIAIRLAKKDPEK